MPSETSSRLRENRYIAWRSGASSITTSMNCAAAGRRSDHADRLVAGFQHDLEGIDDRRPHRHRAHVDVVVDRRRQIGAGQQPALLPHLDGDRARADAVQDLPRQRFRNHAGGRGIQHQRGGIGRRQPVVQPVHAEIGDRGHVDQKSPRSSPAEWSAAAACRTGQAGAAALAAAWPRRFDGWLLVGHGHDIGLDALGVEGCVLHRTRSNYRSLMSAGSADPASLRLLPTKTPRKQIYSRQLRDFEEPRMRRRATLTKTGRSRISRANCPR